MNFQSVSHNVGKSVHQWADHILTLAVHTFQYVPDVHAHVIVRLCFVVNDRDAGLYALDGRPKTVEKSMNRMQYYQHTR